MVMTTMISRVLWLINAHGGDDDQPGAFADHNTGSGRARKCEFREEAGLGSSLISGLPNLLPPESTILP